MLIEDFLMLSKPLDRTIALMILSFSSFSSPVKLVVVDLSSFLDILDSLLNDKNKNKN